MREIKFRVWFIPLDWETEKPKLGRMVYFDKIGYCDEYNHLKFQLAKASYQEDGGSYNNLSASIDDFSSVMQFAGLRDKNGKDIYEGDIVQSAPGGARVVEWLDNQWDENSYHTGFHLGFRSDEYEVIGNIHENPDLLK